ncbi:MAG TPA: spore cortex-lytic enzyme [Firmicutes bacterium]|nr:spore cortex-lytic enzyme [Bacillota bacterium]
MSKAAKKVWQIITIILLNILIIVFISDGGASALSKMGSRGDEVVQIQQKLKDMGYYQGNVDGMYGYQTMNAVKEFQSDNSLSVDGIAGTQTLQALGITENSGTSVGSSDYNLLARVISAEARGEPYNGQVAVGAVIMNRVKHPSFPDTISSVIYQKGAFDCMYDGQINEPVAESAYRAAQEAMNGSDPSGGALYYYNPATATNSWILSRRVITTIGNHVFCE